MDLWSLGFLALVGAVSFLLAFYGSAVGLVLGHLRLPLLIYFLPSTAAGMATNLAISGAGALTGALGHAWAGRVNLRLLALMGLPSLLGAALGGLFLIQVDSSWVRGGIGLFLLGTGYNLARGKPSTSAGEVRFTPWRALSEIVIGLFLGFLAALTGLMLGSVRLPMMIRILKVDPTEAVGTNMAIGCLTAISGAFSLWPREISLPWLPLLIAVPPTVLGGYLGAYYTGKMNKDVLRIVVGWTIILLGIGMTAEAIWRLLV